MRLLLCWSLPTSILPVCYQWHRVSGDDDDYDDGDDDLHEDEDHNDDDAHCAELCWCLLARILSACSLWAVQDDDGDDENDDNDDNDYDNDDFDFENQALPLLQVEREGFPCSCGPQCANPEGRREFDETEVGQ